jgi:hypothetical protein
MTSDFDLKGKASDLENARIIVRDYPGNNSLTVDDWYYAASTYAQAYEKLRADLEVAKEQIRFMYAVASQALAKTGSKE